MDIASIVRSWDTQYLAGRYTKEEPVKFVKTILRYWPQERGLYVGCGNGRNYLPLISSGLDLRGIDVSSVAISELLKKIQNVACMDFFSVSENYDYVISIQTFQYGDTRTARRYFAKTMQIMREGGLFFLRVNSASTVPWHAHEIIERNEYGGFTTLYTDEPKQGLEIHFFTEPEICSMTDGMEVIHSKEVSQSREKPKKGTWKQLEMVMRKVPECK